jgi:RimJ/RimL family protein N-acetyltransferase
MRRIRDHLFVKGAWRDSLAFAITEPDWRAGETA